MDKYIKTQDLIDLTAPVDPENDGSDGCTIVTQNLSFTSDEIEALVDSIPAADVEPVVHGEWMRHRNELWCYCSVCLEDALMSRSTGAEVLSETCPNCGAKMDRQEEGK